MLKVFHKLKKIIREYENLFYLPYKRAVKKDLREEEDAFLMLLFSEELGIPNPVIWHMLEAYPYLLESLHDWHKRMGMEKSPFEGLKCC